MNFYKHHLGDYDGATVHLSWDEDMAYTRLLRAYYRREGPIPDAEKYRLARASSRAQRAAVDTVLQEFFAKGEGGWHNKRADEEITSYKAQSSTNRRIARERTERRNGHEALHGSLDDSSTNRLPNQNPEIKEKPAGPDGPPDPVWGYGLQSLTSAGVGESAARSFIGSLLSSWNQEDVLEALTAANGKADPRGYARAILKSKPKRGAAAPFPA